MTIAHPRHLLFLAVVGLLLAGCAHYVRKDGTPVPPAEASLIRANDAVTAAYSVIGDARDSGVISQADVDQYAAIIKTIDASLDAAGASLRAGDVQGVTRFTDAAREALKRLQPLLVKAKG